MADLFITCPPQLEDLLIKELEGLGLSRVRKGFRGVFVPQDMRAVYLINYCSRFATRVLWQLAQFPCPDREALYRRAKEINWPLYLNVNKTFAIDANVTHPNLRNSLFAAFVVKDAICDQLRDAVGARPSIDVANPDIQFNLFIQNGIATISLDTSRIPLYKRGYRGALSAHAAPIQENIAAAILHIAHYSPADIFCDPFCGSGTFLIESAMMATHTPAGYYRSSFGFFDHPAFNEQEWIAIKNQCDAKKVPLEKGKIFGADKDPKAIATTQAHLKIAGFDAEIEVVAKDIRSYFPKTAPTLVISNPPYGKRLSSSLDLYRSIGHFLKTKTAPAAKGYFLNPDSQSIKETALPIKQSYPLINGGLEVSLFKLQM